MGNYELIWQLASGDLAEVFLAKAAGPVERPVVIKRTLPHLAEESRFIERFLQDARLAAQLNHPNLVQLLDFGEAEGSYFVAMEYVDGLDLRRLAAKAREA